MSFIPYCVCQGCGRGPFPSGLRRCHTAKETDLDYYEEDIEDDRDDPQLVVARCEACQPLKVWDLPTYVFLIVIKCYFRSATLIPFILCAWIFWSEYINPFNFDWKRLDNLGLRVFHLFQVLIVGIPHAILVEIKRNILAFADVVSVLPKDVPIFINFLKPKLFRHCIDSSLPSPDLICSKSMFHNVRYERYIPIYDIFAIVKGATGFYLVTRAFWDESTRTLIIGSMGLWWCYQKSSSLHRYAGAAFCIFLILIRIFVELLSKLGAPVFQDLANNIQNVWKFWVFLESLCALCSICYFLLWRKQTPLPDWPHNRQRYLNLVNRLLVWSDHGEDLLWETEETHGTERTMDMFEVLLR